MKGLSILPYPVPRDTAGAGAGLIQGEARWHAPAPDGEFAYLTIELQDIAYNVRTR